MHAPFINSLRPCDANVLQRTGSLLVQLMVCRLFGAKPFPEAMQTVNKCTDNFYMKIKSFIQRHAFQHVIFKMTVIWFGHNVSKRTMSVLYLKSTVRTIVWQTLPWRSTTPNIPGIALGTCVGRIALRTHAYARCKYTSFRLSTMVCIANTIHYQYLCYQAAIPANPSY